MNGRALHCGEVSIPLSTVVSYTGGQSSEKDLSTAFVTVAIFSSVAAVTAFGVAETGWRTRFLVEGMMFGALAMCAVAELLSARRQTLFTFELRLAGGGSATFVTADADQSRQVKAALDTATNI